MSSACHYPTDVSDPQCEVLHLVLPPTHVASWRTQTEAHGPPPRPQWQFLRQQDRMPMAHAADRVWTVGDRLRLLSPLAGDGGMGARDGHAAPVGTPEPGAAARTLRLLC